MSNELKTTNGQSWGILNPWGDFWTHNTFETKEAARQHLERFFANHPPQGVNLGDFRFVRVQVTLTTLPLTRALSDAAEGGQ